MRHRAALLVVVGKVPFPLLAQNFVATIPKIMAFLSNHQAPFIAKVHRPSASGSRGCRPPWAQCRRGTHSEGSRAPLYLPATARERVLLVSWDDPDASVREGEHWIRLLEVDDPALGPGPLIAVPRGARAA